MTVPDRPRGQAESSARSGPGLFARFAYPPNALGYCGPDDPSLLLGLASDARPADADLRHLAARFDGAWPYLQLIAGCNGIRDPLDRRVVSAYWIGNSLLPGVPPSTLWRHLEERFGRRAGRLFEPMAAPLRLGGVPHHSFHVFAVYPWLGLLRAGEHGPALTVLDRCRIRWGTVVSVSGDSVVVRNRVLDFCGSQLVLGPEIVEQVRRGLDGVGFVEDLAAGDVVAMHWDWVCERLSVPALRNLEQWTALNLAVVNTAPVPGPAVAVDGGAPS